MKPEEKTAEILNMFTAVEGENTLYYGRVRNGKTYNATADIIDLIKRGEVVFANWKIDFSEIELDQRKDSKIVWGKTIFGRKLFFHFDASNFHYFHPDQIDVAFLGRLVNVHLFIDEGQWIFNSQIRTQDPEARKLILHGGHYCRSLNVITQRPANVFLDIRSQINTWYKCEKLLTWPWLVFQRSRIEDMKDGVPDEEKVLSTKVYIADKKVMRAYSTHSMRGANALVIPTVFEVYSTTASQRFALLVHVIVPKRVVRAWVHFRAYLGIPGPKGRILTASFYEKYGNKKGRRVEISH